MCSTAGLCWDVDTLRAGTPQQCCVHRLWVILQVHLGVRFEVIPLYCRLWNADDVVLNAVFQNHSEPRVSISQLSINAEGFGALDFPSQLSDPSAGFQLEILEQTQ